jgi:uncharacterized protein (DUF1778 family)
MDAQRTYTLPVKNKDERINLRVDAEQKGLLEAASEAEHTSVSAFVLSAATSAAAHVLADRRAFTLDADDWAVFDEALNRPPRAIPGLSELMSQPPLPGEEE